MKKTTIYRQNKKKDKIKYLIKEKNYNSDDYDDIYLKFKINSDEDFPIEKTSKIYGVIIHVRSVFNDKNNYCHQINLEEHLLKLAE